MSFNDRCGEAAAILDHGGVLPTEVVRAALIEWFEQGRDGYNFPPRDLVRAVLDHPDNADLRRQTWDGEWHGFSPGKPADE
jgi:hypothetical protein